MAICCECAGPLHPANILQTGSPGSLQVNKETKLSTINNQTGFLTKKSLGFFCLLKTVRSEIFQLNYVHAIKIFFAFSTFQIVYIISYYPESYFFLYCNSETIYFLLTKLFKFSRSYVFFFLSCLLGNYRFTLILKYCTVHIYMDLILNILCQT